MGWPIVYIPTLIGPIAQIPQQDRDLHWRGQLLLHVVSEACEYEELWMSAVD